MRLTRPAVAFAAAALLAPSSGLLPGLGVAAEAQTSRSAGQPAGADASHQPAATPPASGPAGAAKPAAPANPNPVIASVNGQPITLDDVRAAAQSLPEDARNMPPSMLFPMVVNQVIDQKALLIAAEKTDLPRNPRVEKIMQDAANTALQNVYLTREISPLVTEQAVRDAYDKTIGSKQGEKEVHARHILVATEAQAKSIIRQLDHGADFAKLAAKLSTDKASAAQNGGDLGWFKQGDMLPAFSSAAFAMKKGQISQTPVHTQYGWHVIQVLDTRIAPPPGFDSVKDQIRQKLIQQDVRQVVQKALGGVTVVRYKPDGTPVTDSDKSMAPATGAPPVPNQSGPATPGSEPKAD